MSSERQLPEIDNRWWGEHVHRYNEAVKYATSESTILDIACGTGFGTDILAAYTKKKVIGGDISLPAIEQCKEHWKKENLEFKILDGTNLEYNDNFFDLVVSFETIEHTTSYKKMLSEFKRVLKPGGVLILSTPNAAITSPNGKILNPYHTQEFQYDELKQLLTGSFTDFHIYGQRYSRYDSNTVTKKIGSVFEKLMLSFGIRKLPYKTRNRFMKFFFGYSLYPKPGDFSLETNTAIIKGKAPVLFAICRK